MKLCRNDRRILYPLAETGGEYTMEIPILKVLIPSELVNF